MSEALKYYPAEQNLGKDCQYWCIGGLATGCCFPKIELKGRRSCEGVVDDVCLFIKDARQPSSLSESQMNELKSRMPSLIDKSYLPPGDTV